MKGPTARYVAYYKMGLKPRRIGPTGNPDPAPGTLVLILGGNRIPSAKAKLTVILGGKLTGIMTKAKRAKKAS